MRFWMFWNRILVCVRERVQVSNENVLFALTHTYKTKTTKINITRFDQDYQSYQNML